jgi:hypothetical protein
MSIHNLHVELEGSAYFYKGTFVVLAAGQHRRLTVQAEPGEVVGL